MSRNRDDDEDDDRDRRSRRRPRTDRDKDDRTRPSSRKGGSLVWLWVLFGALGVVVFGGCGLALVWAVGQVREAAARKAEESKRQQQTPFTQSASRPIQPTQQPPPQPQKPSPLGEPPPEVEWGPNPWKADATRPNPMPRDPAPKQPTATAYKTEKPSDADPKLLGDEKSVYLDDMEPFDVKLGPWKLGRNGWLGSDPNQWVIVNKVYADHALGMHPPADGASKASFAVGGKARTLRGHVGVDDSSSGNLTPVTFVVLADGKEVWWSRPLQERTATIPFSVDVTGVQVITLEVRCPGTAFGAHCVWLDPELVK